MNLKNTYIDFLKLLSVKNNSSTLFAMSSYIEKLCSTNVNAALRDEFCCTKTFDIWRQLPPYRQRSLLHENCLRLALKLINGQLVARVTFWHLESNIGKLLSYTRSVFTPTS
jgi:hypothetical protein